MESPSGHSSRRRCRDVNRCCCRRIKPAEATLVRICEQGEVLELGYDGAMCQHPGSLWWGTAVGFRAMQAAAQALSRDRLWSRDDLYIVTGHPGPGVRDAVDYVTDVVGRGRYHCVVAKDCDMKCNSKMKFEWWVSDGREPLPSNCARNSFRSSSTPSPIASKHRRRPRKTSRRSGSSRSISRAHLERATRGVLRGRGGRGATATRGAARRDRRDLLRRRSGVMDPWSLACRMPLLRNESISRCPAASVTSTTRSPILDPARNSREGTARYRSTGPTPVRRAPDQAGSRSALRTGATTPEATA